MDYDLMNKGHKATIILYARGATDLPAASSKQLAAWLDSSVHYVHALVRPLVRAEFISCRKIKRRAHWRATPKFLLAVTRMTDLIMPALARAKHGLAPSYSLMRQLDKVTGTVWRKWQGTSMWWAQRDLITLAALYRAKVVLAMPVTLKNWAWLRMSTSEWLKEQHVKSTEEAVQVLAGQGSRTGECFASLPREALHL